MAVTSCRECAAPMEWGLTPAGKRAPFDIEHCKDAKCPRLHYHETLNRTPHGTIMERVEGGGRHSHFQTCTNPARFSKKAQARV